MKPTLPPACSTMVTQHGKITWTELKPLGWRSVVGGCPDHQARNSAWVSVPRSMRGKGRRIVFKVRESIGTWIVLSSATFTHRSRHGEATRSSFRCGLLVCQLLHPGVFALFLPWELSQLSPLPSLYCLCPAPCLVLYGRDRTLTRACVLVHSTRVHFWCASLMFRCRACLAAFSQNADLVLHNRNVQCSLSKIPSLSNATNIPALVNRCRHRRRFTPPPPSHLEMRHHLFLFLLLSNITRTRVEMISTLPQFRWCRTGQTKMSSFFSQRYFKWAFFVFVTV